MKAFIQYCIIHLFQVHVQVPPNVNKPSQYSRKVAIGVMLLKNGITSDKNKKPLRKFADKNTVNSSH